jgi:sulfur-carrier protein
LRSLAVKKYSRSCFSRHARRLCGEMVLLFSHMNITVQIPSALRRHTGGTAKVSCSAANLDELFTDLDSKFPDLKPHLRDDSGQVRRFLNVYVNEEDIRFLGGPNYAFKEGDEVLLVPSIAGGRAD